MTPTMIIALMSIAKSNGSVTGVGYDNDTRVSYSTAKHPLIESVQYHPEVENKLESLLIGSITMLSKL